MRKKRELYTCVHNTGEMMNMLGYGYWVFCCKGLGRHSQKLVVGQAEPIDISMPRSFRKWVGYDGDRALITLRDSSEGVFLVDYKKPVFEVYIDANGRMFWGWLCEHIDDRPYEIELLEIPLEGSLAINECESCKPGTFLHAMSNNWPQKSG